MSSEKGNTFQGITFFPGKTDSVQFVCLPVPGFLSRESDKIYQYFVHGTALRRVQKEKKNSHLKGNFYQNFRVNSTRINQWILELLTLSPEEDHL